MFYLHLYVKIDTQYLDVCEAEIQISYTKLHKIPGFLSLPKTESELVSKHQWVICAATTTTCLVICASL